MVATDTSATGYGRVSQGIADGLIMSGFPPLLSDSFTVMSGLPPFLSDSSSVMGGFHYL
jgi:hypothetical protein